METRRLEAIGGPLDGQRLVEWDGTLFVVEYEGLLYVLSVEAFIRLSNEWEGERVLGRYQRNVLRNELDLSRGAQTVEKYIVDRDVFEWVASA